MQLISNNMQASSGDSGPVPCVEHSNLNCATCGPNSQMLAGANNIIDPQLLESLFSIDQEEEECSDSSDDYEEEDDDIDDDVDKDASESEERVVNKVGGAKAE